MTLTPNDKLLQFKIKSQELSHTFLQSVSEEGQEHEIEATEAFETSLFILLLVIKKMFGFSLDDMQTIFADNLISIAKYEEAERKTLC